MLTTVFATHEDRVISKQRSASNATDILIFGHRNKISISTLFLTTRTKPSQKLTNGRSENDALRHLKTATQPPPSAASGPPPSARSCRQHRRRTPAPRWRRRSLNLNPVRVAIASRRGARIGYFVRVKVCGIYRFAKTGSGRHDENEGIHRIKQALPPCLNRCLLLVQ